MTNTYLLHTTKQCFVAACIYVIFTAFANAYTQDTGQEIAQDNTPQTSSAQTQATDAQRLQQASEIRSIDPLKAKEILGTINIDALTELEREQYSYLEAYSFFILGDIEQAITHFEKLNQQDISTDMRYKVKASLVSLYSGALDWDKAFKTLDSLLAAKAGITDTATLEHGHAAVSNFYTLLDELELVAQYTNPLRGEAFSPRFLCLINVQWAGAQLEVDINKVKESDFIKTIENCKAINENTLAFAGYNNLAAYYYKMGNIDKSREILISNIEAVEKVRYPPLAAEYYELLAKSYMDAQNYSQAELYATKLLNKKFKQFSQNTTTTAFDILSRVSEIRGDYEEALGFYKQKSAALKRNVDEKNAKQLNIQKAQRAIEDKTKEIALLDRQNTILQTQADLDKQSARNRLLLIILMAFVLLSLAAWVYSKRRTYVKLRKVAEIDDLTKTLNRRYFTHMAKQTIESSTLLNKSVCFIMLDLYNLNKINDSFGHQAGDMALQLAAKAVKSACRQNDILGRIGGEEFGILLDGCNSQEGYAIAESCRKAIEAAGSSSKLNDEISLTASFGVADNTTTQRSLDKLMANADKALYKAKEEGRNRVAMFGGSD